MGGVGEPKSGNQAIVRAPEDLIYRSFYAPVDLRRVLEDPMERGKIRRLPAPQLYFSLKELDPDEVHALLPYVTEEQWRTVLDLDLWEKDRMSVGLFLRWQQMLLEADDAVAKKLLRATEPEQWELAFLRELEIYPRTEEDEFAGEPEDRPAWTTPDGAFLIGLPRNVEKQKLFHALLVRLYQLQPEQTALWLAEAAFRTPIELEEEAYQERRRRLEVLGFVDYFDAVSVYTPRKLTEPLREKEWRPGATEEVLPTAVRRMPVEGPLLLFQALAAEANSDRLEPLIEELFYVCNKVLAADRATAEEPSRVRRSVRKAVTGINLGLSVWSDDNLERAASGVRRYFLESFFQLGFGQLSEVRRQARALAGRDLVEPGSYLEAVLEGFLLRYPVLTEQREGGIRRRYLENQSDLQWAFRLLDEIRSRGRRPG